MLESDRACRESDCADAECFAKGTPRAVRIWHTGPARERSIRSNMSATLFVLAFVIAPSQQAASNEAKPLQLRVPKAALAASAPSSTAPFAMPIGAEPELALQPPSHDLRQDQGRSSCSGESALCYDAAERRIVYKPARNLMPDLPGFTRENISVKRDRVVFRYSF